MIGRDLILAAIPHTHRNRLLDPEERGLLIGFHQRKIHREAERMIKGDA